MEAALSEINLRDSVESGAHCSHCGRMPFWELLELKECLMLEQDIVHDT